MTSAPQPSAFLVDILDTDDGHGDALLPAHDYVAQLTSEDLQWLDSASRGEWLDSAIQLWMRDASYHDAPGFSDSAELWEELLINWEFDERTYCTLSHDLQFLHDAIIEEILYSTDAYSPQDVSPAELLEAVSPDMFINCVAFCSEAQQRIRETW